MIAFAAIATLMLAGCVFFISLSLLYRRRQNTDTDTVNPENRHSPSLRGPRGVAIAVALFLLIAAPAFYIALGAPQQLQPVAAPTDIIASGEQIQQRLQSTPDDVELLALAGKNMMQQQRYAEAAYYYGRARQQNEDSPAFLVAHLEALAWAEDPRTAEVLTVALAQLPNEPLVLWIAGLRAQQQGDTASAKKHWQKLHALLEGSELQQQIEAALAHLEIETAPAENTATAAVAAVTVAVSLSPELQKEVTDDMALFIFARGEQRPIPLAIKRHNSGRLPLTVVLDDAASMSPAAKMSDAQSYKIVARISKSGDALAQPGDLYGEARAQQGDSVSIIINQVHQPQ